MEGTRRRRPESEGGGSSCFFSSDSGKRLRTSEQVQVMDDHQQIQQGVDGDHEEEDLLIQFQIEEDMIVEAMKVLEEELSRPKIVVDNNDIPSSSSSEAIITCDHPLLFTSSSGKIVMNNGNEESCGASFSDSSSTVMASVDMGSMSIPYLMSFIEDYFAGLRDQSTSTTTTTTTVLSTTPMSCCSFLAVGGSSSSSTEMMMIKGGCSDEEDVDDDEWIERVLNGDVFEFDLGAES